MTNFILALCFLTLIVLFYLMVRNTYVCKWRGAMIDEYFDWRHEQIRIVSELAMTMDTVVDSRTGKAINRFDDYDKLPSFDDCYYSYNEMLYTYWYIWDASEFIKIQYMVDESEDDDECMECISER